MGRVRQYLGRFSVTGLALVLGVTVLSVPTVAADDPDVELPTCLIVDTDVGLDDLRAFAVVMPRRQLRAVVVTEGIAGVSGGSSAVSMFLASRGDSPPVVPGLASPAPPPYEWLPAARAGAERLNNFLHAAIPFAGGKSDKMTNAVVAAVSGCGRIDVLVLGPWTSYVRYAPALGSSRLHVVASGRSLAENNPDNFNCEYDLGGCRAAVPVLQRARSTVFVDLPPADVGATYDPTEPMIAQLEQTGMPGLLRTALRVDPSQWLGTRLWDDAAALYLLAPRLFAARGGHLEPAVSEEVFRTHLTNAINAD